MRKHKAQGYILATTLVILVVLVVLTLNQARNLVLLHKSGLSSAEHSLNH